MKPEYLKKCDLNNVNFENVQNLLDYEDFYFGTSRFTIKRFNFE